jgi:hypothetical protein
LAIGARIRRRVSLRYRLSQRRGDPELLVELDEPFHRQLVPAEVLNALLGDERQALVPGDPLQRGLRVIGGRRVLSGQLRQCHRDLWVLVVIHHGRQQARLPATVGGRAVLDVLNDDHMF